MVSPLGNDGRGLLVGARRGRVRRGPDHAVRHDRLPGRLRVRGQGPRRHGLRRLQGLAADGPLHAPRARGRPPGGGRLRDRHRARARAHRRRGRDRDRRAEVVRVAASRCSTSAARTASTRSRSSRSSRTSPRAGSRWSSGRRGRSSRECTACAASNMALGDGLDAIRLGRADVMICGGTEAPVSRVGIAGFGAMRAISRRNDDPKARVAPVRRRARRVRDGRGRRR